MKKKKQQQHILYTFTVKFLLFISITNGYKSHVNFPIKRFASNLLPTFHIFIAIYLKRMYKKNK